MIIDIDDDVYVGEVVHDDDDVGSPIYSSSIGI